MSKSYILISYAIGIALLAGAVYLTRDWVWAVRIPLLAYLGLCTLVFPLSRLPAEVVLVSVTMWSPIEITGIIVWAVLAVFYAVVWAFGLIFAPIGAVMHWASKRKAPESQ